MTLRPTIGRRGGDSMSNLATRGNAAKAGFAGFLTALFVAPSAFAVGDAAIGSAVTSATTTLTDTITAAIPLILGVTVIMVVLGLGKKLVRKAG